MREGTAAAWPENDEELGAGYNALEEEGKGLEGREDTAAAWFENDDELGLMLAEGSTVAALVEDNKGLGYVST